MWSSARDIAAGDVVIIWQTRDAITPIIVTPGQTWNSKFGTYPHDSIVGLPYGSKVSSKIGRGFVHVLRPTPELWTLALPHRTQILYAADIAFVMGWLDIGPGSKVIEAGTGSGSFSHSVARTIGPAGKLWSYEFHALRAQKAREEFTRHGLDDLIVLTHRNVCKDGFTVQDTVDCVFLDLPAPWLAIEHAKKALRKDRIARICCFSPCMEQVMKTVTSLNNEGFTEITMYETLTRPHDVFQTGSCLSEPTSIFEVGERLKKAEIKREEKRLRQVAASRAGHLLKESGEDQLQNIDDGSVIAMKRKRSDNEMGIDGADFAAQQDELEAKRPKTEDMSKAEVEEQVPSALPSTSMLAQGQQSALRVPNLPLVSRPLTEVRGHTSYLTFASLIPKHSRAKTPETILP